MKLQGKLAATARKCLMRRQWRCGQQLASCRDIERVAVPVEHRGTGKLRQRAAQPRCGHVHRAPAYFFLRPGIDLCAKGGGHDLRPKANAQQGLARSQPLRHHGPLVKQEGIDVFFAHANGAAQNHGQIRILPQIAGHGAHPGLHIGHVIAGLFQRLLKNAQMLKSHMLHGNTTFHISLTGSTLQPRYPHEQPPASNHFCSVNVD